MRIIEDKRALEELQKIPDKEENKMAKEKGTKRHGRSRSRAEFPAEAYWFLKAWGKKKRICSNIRKLPDFSRT